MNTPDENSTDAQLERCFDELQESQTETPAFDDIVSRRQHNHEPLLNRRNLSLWSVVSF